jgi:hypothetical protein
VDDVVQDEEPLNPQLGKVRKQHRELQSMTSLAPPRWRKHWKGLPDTRSPPHEICARTTFSSALTILAY